MYVITKNQSYEHLHLSFSQVVQTQIYIHRGKNTYLAATEASQIEVATEIPYEEFGDSEYLYVIAVA